MTTFFLFVFGAAIGSFLNVVILRHDTRKFLLGKSLLGRSHCPHCRKTLSPAELIPIVSFIIQRGRCRTCRTRLSLQYPIVEILGGLIFFFVPPQIKTFYFALSPFELVALSALWVLVFLSLLVVFFIDLRLSIIPDEANLFLGLLGISIIALGRNYFGPTTGSFLGGYSLIFGLRTSMGIWLNHFLAAAVAAALFALIIFATRGRGMGMGDLKLAIPLGLIFGWPDIILVLGLSFIIGSIFGLGGVALRRKNLKSSIPFGPFLAAASALVFFFGETLVGSYFKLLNF